MRRAILSILAIFYCSGLSAAEWTLIKHEGRDYVTFENVATFYGMGDVQRVSNNRRGFSLTVGSRSLRGNAGSVEFFINNLKFNLSYPLIEHNGKLCVSRMDLVKVIEPVMRPGKIADTDRVDTVILDPGHGGHDNGAVSIYGNEKTFSLDVATRARALLLKAGYKVQMTRSNDSFVGLNERVAFANRFPTGLFISIHFNSGGAGTGIETYTLAPRGVPSMMADGPRISDLQACRGNGSDGENMALATATHASLIVHLRACGGGMYDRGIKRARFVVIRDIAIPGVLIEGGFLSSGYDAKLIATPTYRQAMAASLVSAVQNYRRAVGPRQIEVARSIVPNVQLRSMEPTPAAAPEPAAAAPEPAVATAPEPAVATAPEPAVAAPEPASEPLLAAEPVVKN